MESSSPVKYRVRHITRYQYGDSVALCQNQAWLQPRRTESQTQGSFQLEIVPEPVVRRPWVDYHGNHAWYFAVEQPHTELTVTSHSVVDRSPPRTVDVSQTPPWEVCRDRITHPVTADQRTAVQFLYESPFVRTLPDVIDYARASFSAERPLLETAMDLTQRIHADFQYDPAATSLSTPLGEVMKRRRGVCQDFAHLQLACFRGWGIPARYVSGYLLTDPPPGQQKLVGSDASHAWVAVYCPDVGWIDLDPTNNCLPGVRHITTAWGRDYSEVCPIKGVFIGGGRHAMQVAVDVTPVEADHFLN